MAEDAFTTIDARDLGLPTTTEPNQEKEATPADFIPTEEWVITRLLPILVALSRRGVICLIDSGIQNLNRSI